MPFDYEKALRNKFRFNHPLGLLSLEDLWELPLHELDSIARDVHTQIRHENEVSFLKPKKDTLNSNMEYSLDILKHVIEVKLEERDASLAAVKRKAERDKLLDILARKKDQGLEALDIEELEAKIAALSSD